MNVHNGTVYGRYCQRELDAQYDQRTIVPDHSAYVERWQQLSRAARQRLDCHLDIAYGSQTAERLDIFPAGEGAPVHAFFHGGAWRKQSKNEFSFLAPIFVAEGITYVAVDFAQATETAFAEIVRQVRASIAWLYLNVADFGGNPSQIFVSGHSSGAHLAATTIMEGWEAEFDLPQRLVRGATLVSGIYDLEPVRLSARNQYLNLDPETAERFSPVRHIPADCVPADILWGDGELDEFRRQSRDFALAWRANCVDTGMHEMRGCNHFDMANAFADPASPVIRCAIDQIRKIGAQQPGKEKT